MKRLLVFWLLTMATVLLFNEAAGSLAYLCTAQQANQAGLPPATAEDCGKFESKQEDKAPQHRVAFNFIDRLTAQSFSAEVLKHPVAPHSDVPYSPPEAG